MKECNICHEVKPCKKVLISASLYLSNCDLYEFRCQDCLDYEEHLVSQKVKEEEKRLKKYIKKRDNYLLNANHGLGGKK